MKTTTIINVSGILIMMIFLFVTSMMIKKSIEEQKDKQQLFLKYLERIDSKEDKIKLLQEENNQLKKQIDSASVFISTQQTKIKDLQNEANNQRNRIDNFNADESFRAWTTALSDSTNNR